MTGNSFCGVAFASPAPVLTGDESKLHQWEQSGAPGPQAASAFRQRKLKTLKWHHSYKS